MELCKGVILSYTMLSIILFQKAIREFLKVRTSYDVLPLSFRLIILNTDLLVKKSLNILIQNGKHYVAHMGEVING
jgi:hypothetical protein